MIYKSLKPLIRGVHQRQKLNNVVQFVSKIGHIELSSYWTSDIQWIFVSQSEFGHWIIYTVFWSTGDTSHSHSLCIANCPRPVEIDQGMFSFGMNCDSDDPIRYIAHIPWVRLFEPLWEDHQMNNWSSTEPTTCKLYIYWTSQMNKRGSMRGILIKVAIQLEC